MMLRGIKCFAKILYILVCGSYMTWAKEDHGMVPSADSIIMVVGALEHCTLLHSLCNLKAAQMSVQHSLICELMLYRFELSYSIVEATKNIYGTKCEDVVDCSTTRNFARFVRTSTIRYGQKNWFWCCTPNYRGKSSSKRRVSGDLGIS